MARLTAKARKVRMNGGGYRDVQALLISDRGGEDNISEAKKLMVRRIATQEIEGPSVKAGAPRGHRT